MDRQNRNFGIAQQGVRVIQIGLLLGMCLTTTARAQDTMPENGQIQELQTKVKLLTEQLQAIQQQLKQIQAESKNPVPAIDGDAAEAEVAEKARAAQGPGPHQPVYADFRNGLVLQDASGNWAMRIYGRMQADYRHFSPDDVGSDTFSLRRTRLGAFLTLRRDVTLRIEGEYNTSTGVSVNDAYLDYTRWSGARIRIGQFKPFYGLERTTGAFDFDFQERSMADSLLGPVFDRGIMLHGEPLKGLYYNVALVNGVGPSDDTVTSGDGKDMSLRITGNLAQWLDMKNSVIHIGGFYAYGDQGPGSAMPAPRTEANGIKFFSTTNGTGSDTLKFGVDRTRSGMETALAYGPVKLQGEYIRARFDGQGFTRDLSSWYTNLSWFVTGEHHADFYGGSTFGKIKPLHEFEPAGGWGALELGLRYSHFDGSDITQANLDGTGRLAAGYSNEASAWTLGAKWILNPYSSLLFNYVHTDFDMPLNVSGGGTEDTEDALALRAQFDF
jgi:phosphate-selective porin OprO/OprP